MNHILKMFIDTSAVAKSEPNGLPSLMGFQTEAQSNYGNGSAT
jgi:hypothetical protein